MPQDRAQYRLRLVEHQSRRLRDTYADYAAQDVYRQVTDFFFDAIYSTRDKTRRDADFKSLYEYFNNKLGMEMIRALGRLVDLNELTGRLDELVTDQLMRLSRTPSFTHRHYEQAYRDCDNYDDRVIQIRRTVECMEFFHQVSQWRSMALMMKVVRLTARLKGAGELGDFLENGFNALRSVSDLSHFSQLVERREMERLDRIWREYEPSRRAARKA